MREPILDEEEPQQQLIRTGKMEVDKQLGGGIPIGSLVLIEGQSDAGKSVLAQQIMWGALNDEHRVLLFTTENTVKSMNSQMDSLGLGIADALVLGWIKIFTVEPSKMKQMDTFSTINSTIMAYPTSRLIVVDSLTPVLAHTTTDSVIDYFERCKKLCDGGRTIMNIAHTYAFDEQVLIRIRSVCDAHLRLRIEEVKERLVKVLEVCKVRGAVKVTGNIVNFDVEPGIGMRVMPIGRARV